MDGYDPDGPITNLLDQEFTKWEWDNQSWDDQPRWEDQQLVACDRNYEPWDYQKSAWEKTTFQTCDQCQKKCNKIDMVDRYFGQGNYNLLCKPCSDGIDEAEKSMRYVASQSSTIDDSPSKQDEVFFWLDKIEESLNGVASNQTMKYIQNARDIIAPSPSITPHTPNTVELSEIEREFRKYK